MIALRKGSERGHAEHGWLDSYHSFSFADYQDERYMGFRSLRVINEDRVKPGEGFGTHGHRDMEIITYVLEGALAHKDSLGTGSVIRPGDVQRMSAGTGVTHSEFNASQEAPVHFMQIWITPAQGGIAPGYEERRFDEGDKRGQLRLIAAPHAEAASRGAVALNQDAHIYAALLDGDEHIVHAIAPGRGVYVQLARGTLRANGVPLTAGDAVRLEDESELTLDQGRGAEVLVFDLS